LVKFDSGIYILVFGPGFTSTQHLNGFVIENSNYALQQFIAVI
jgi:hypothetical protein